MITVPIEECVYDGGVKILYLKSYVLGLDDSFLVKGKTKTVEFKRDHLTTSSKVNKEGWVFRPVKESEAPDVCVFVYG